MAQYAYASKLSENIALTDEGYLICTNAVICRSGTQQYHRSELGESSGSNELVDVFRPVEEVTAKEFLASIAGKAFTVNHPGNGFLNPMNHSWSARGTVLNPRIGPPDKNGDITIVADILITDAEAIRRVLDGMRELSCGYQYELAEGPHGLEMRDLRFNHLALVEAGRAGTAQIRDSEPAESYEAMMRRYHRVNASEVQPPPARQGKDAVLNWGGGVNNYHIEPGGEGDTPSMTEGENLTTAVSEDEENMQKTQRTEDQERAARIDRLCDALEKLVTRRMRSAEQPESEEFTDLIPAEPLPKSERPQNPLVDDLRALRPYIEASGDRKMIDAFNKAMIAAKAGRVGPAQTLLAVCDREPERSFEKAVARRREELLGGKPPSETTDNGRCAEDRQPEAESFQKSIDRRRREMLSEKHPRG